MPSSVLVTRKSHFLLLPWTCNPTYPSIDWTAGSRYPGAVDWQSGLRVADPTRGQQTPKRRCRGRSKEHGEERRTWQGENSIHCSWFWGCLVCFVVHHLIPRTQQKCSFCSKKRHISAAHPFLGLRHSSLPRIWYSGHSCAS